MALLQTKAVRAIVDIDKITLVGGSKLSRIDPPDLYPAENLGQDRKNVQPKMNHCSHSHLFQR